MARGTRAHPPVLKRLGQHFLTDQSALNAIAEALTPAPQDAVIEIGPGRGSLTDLLAARAQRLTVIEIDHALADNLRDRYRTSGNVTVIEDDVLKVDVGALAGGPFVVAGNVPYYITTPILFHVLRPPFPRHAVFLVQREVGERIVASPGSRTYGALSVTVQAFSDATIVRHVPATAFRPPPKVESSIVRITPRVQGLIMPAEVEPFRVFVQAAFGMRRKQMVNVLRAVRRMAPADASAMLEAAGLDPHARPETLSPSQFVTLMRMSPSGP